MEQTLDPKRGYCEKMSVLEAAMYDNKKDAYARAFHLNGIEKERELEERRRQGCDKFLLNADAWIGINWVMISFMP